MTEPAAIVPDGKGIVSFTIDDMLHYLENFRKGETDTLAKTGFTKLDETIYGYLKGEITIIGARPGMGKSSFLINQILKIGHEQKVPVAFFSLELSRHLVMDRVTSQIAGKRFVLGSLNKYSSEEQQTLTEVLKQLREDPIYFYDAPYCQIQDLLDQMSQLVNEKQVKVFFIDYLQAIRSHPKKGTIRDEEMAFILRKIKAWALENNAAVVISSTLSRAVETRGGDKKPCLSDLRESGHIELMADKVLFVYRPAYYNITEDERGNSLLHRAEIIVAKNSRGPMEEIHLTFDPFTGNFRNDINIDEIDFTRFNSGESKTPF